MKLSRSIAHEKKGRMVSSEEVTLAANKTDISPAGAGPCILPRDKVAWSKSKNFFVVQ